MLYYLLHQSSIWKNNNKLTDGQRNVRIFMVVVVIYILLRSLLCRYKDTNFLAQTLFDYFYYFIIADIIAAACLYKMYYGRSIVKELNRHETDIYDPKNHKYYPPNARIGITIQDYLVDDQSESQKSEEIQIGPSIRTVGTSDTKSSTSSKSENENDNKSENNSENKTDKKSENNSDNNSDNIWVIHDPSNKNE